MSDEAKLLDHPVPLGCQPKNPSGVVHVREYVGAMSAELAGMARRQGDEKLACILDIAADIANGRLQNVTG